jgi:hypothetical protein
MPAARRYSPACSATLNSAIPYFCLCAHKGRQTAAPDTVHFKKYLTKIVSTSYKLGLMMKIVMFSVCLELVR